MKKNAGIRWKFILVVLSWNKHPVGQFSIVDDRKQCIYPQFLHLTPNNQKPFLCVSTWTSAPDILLGTWSAKRPFTAHRPSCFSNILLSKDILHCLTMLPALEALWIERFKLWKWTNPYTWRDSLILIFATSPCLTGIKVNKFWWLETSSE
jgi:hypothetical protein